MFIVLFCRKIDAEIWLKEGIVVNPKFKNPDRESITTWKLFIKSAYTHPNILAHQDLQLIRDFFQLCFNVYLKYETSNLIVELDVC